MRTGSTLACLLIATFALVTTAAQSPQVPGLRVGAARVDITPPLAAGSPARTYDHEQLFARAIVLDNGTTRAALVSLDQGGVSDDLWAAASKAIAAEIDAPVTNVLISATHTHSSNAGGTVGRGGPPPAAGTVGRGGGAPPAPGAAPTAPPTPPLVTPILEAVRQAKSALQPARVGFGHGSSWLNVNRDTIDPETRKWTQAPNPDAASDKTVAVLKFETPAGVPIAAYVNYAMHPVNGYLAGFVSADFPGAAMRYIEQTYGDRMVALFSQGASGDQNPLYLRAGTNMMASRTGIPVTGNVLVREKVEAPLREGTAPSTAGDAKVRDRLLRWIESQGQLLGEEVIRVMTNTTRLDTQPRVRGVQTTISCPGRTRTGTIVREGAPGEYASGAPVQIRLGALLVGDTALASINAEVYTLISQRIKQQSPLSNTVVVTLANGRAGSGYIPDDASYGHETFQVLGTRLQPGCAEKAIADGLTQLISDNR